MMMHRELYFDISSAQSGGSLYRILREGAIVYAYNHSTYDDNRDELKVFDTDYPSFEAFWEALTANKEWFYLHPLFVHPEQRAFVTRALQTANWAVHPDPKWQQSHQRQWKKVLEEAPKGYYNPG